MPELSRTTGNKPRKRDREEDGHEYIDIENSGGGAKGFDGLAAALAAIAGVIIGIGLSFTPTSGLAYLTIGFTVVVLGGLGSVSGTLVAAMLVGLAQAIGGALFGPVYQLLTVYLLFILLLALRPQGLFGGPAS